MIWLRTIRICVLLVALAVLAGCGGGGGGAGNSAVTQPLAPPVATALGAMGPPLHVVDLDSDGKVDVTVAARAATGTLDDLAIFLGNGDATFRAAGTITGASNAAIADLDGDGKRDLAYCAGANTVEIRLGKGDGTFGAPTTFTSGPPSSACRLVAVGDVDGDGRPDIVVANADPPNPQAGIDARFAYVMRGNGDGTFAPAVLAFDNGRWIMSMSMADLNKDGRFDLIVNWVSLDTFSAGAEARLGRADGSFDGAISVSAVVPGAPAATSATCCVDLNGDGFLDLFLSEIALHMPAQFSPKHSYVLLGNGDGTFHNAGQVLDGTVSAWADFDGDGRVDLIVAQIGAIEPSAGSKLLFYGNGNGTFAAPVQLPAFDGTVYAAADVNGDRRPDLLALRVSPDGNTTNLLLLLNSLAS